MRKYRVVCLKKEFLEMVEMYPVLASMLYLPQNSIYESKQVELLFNPIHKEKEMLLSVLNERDDYSYYHGIHTLFNPITEETIQIKMNEYDIEVEEKEGKHVIFDILKGFSKNFYMIEL